ncbi:tetratricopeptide repeat protein [Primorskyibacter flagellatus]|uniref:Ca-activated chloride channel family protein n=1 Tax=Primorskyibacter flagellatus TaxID=1387277 RepID=A0A1W2A4Y4_9RHOB|nr:tetratricopeptide repeat protein [Primorskyibacter flagellatus]SMC55532.1 Ca-activated chloride channel family protein [Primorskyibacter flagellatus]
MKVLALIAAAATALALILGGTSGFGRVLLSAGMPALATPLFKDAQWRGVALYRARKLSDAAEAFADARAYYNLGTAQARDGKYSAALEAYDRVIPGGDGDAQANFDLIAAYYASLGIDPEVLGLFGEQKEGVIEESFVAQGNARAAGTGDEVTNASAMLGNVELRSNASQKVRRVFDDRFMVADERWLRQLADVPGEYLAARISQERKRRKALGLEPPTPEDPR